jgi:hypothetical protein
MVRRFLGRTIPVDLVDTRIGEDSYNLPSSDRVIICVYSSFCDALDLL